MIAGGEGGGGVWERELVWVGGLRTKDCWEMMGLTPTGWTAQGSGSPQPHCGNGSFISAVNEPARGCCVCCLQSQSDVFLEASHILQRAQQQAGVIGGVLLNRSR